MILPDGKVVGDSDDLPEKMDNHADRPEVADALAGRTGSSQRYSYTLKETRMYVAVPLKASTNALPSPDQPLVGARRGTQRVPGGEGGDKATNALTLSLSQRERGQTGKIIGVLRISISMSVVDRAVSAIQFRIAIGGFAIAILMALVSLWISRRITRPLEHLRIRRETLCPRQPDA